ncbi:ATP-dependent endonuclease [Lewinella sp. LCG006]|uniref:ATP-dependent nuclease n=1 Tax=Lewinella sp. LCG006 TaxID=3231911 RepID=UPI003460D34C
MKLKKLSIKGLKCYEDSGEIPFHNLTVFIGENDAGKSTIFDAIEIILNNKNPGDEDFRDDADAIQIELTLTPSSENVDISKFILDGELKIRRIIPKSESSKYFCYLEVYSDNELNNYNDLNAPELKALLERYGIDRKSNQAERKGAVEDYLKRHELPKTRIWQEIRYNSIVNHLPIFQRFSSSDYGNPEGIIRKTLEIVYRNSFYEKDEDGNEVLKESFQGLKRNITSDLDNKLENQLLGHIKKYKPEIDIIKGNYNIDFSRGLSFFGLNIIDASGKEKSISQIGEGSKKKIFLSILEWDAEINATADSNRFLIRGYDEPDSNLHYDAQRKMFYVIRDLAEDESLNIQSIICTHSLTMIDRAPANNINHVLRNEVEEKSRILYLDTDESEDIRQFLSKISEISGIKNSSIFYEKCFLLVEGESEQNAIPILYKTFTKKDLIEDGIVLINLQTNGQWSNALKFLHKNKKDCTILLLDKDTQFPNSKNQVTLSKLREVGFDDDFLENHCFFIGAKEFEDVFTNIQLKNTCTRAFVKDDESEWTINDFESIRNSVKFSKDLRRLISTLCKRNIGKPEIASEIAFDLTKEEIENIEILKNAFMKIQSIIE